MGVGTFAEGLCRFFVLCGRSAFGGIVIVFLRGVGADQAIFTVTDQIASAGFTECRHDNLSVFGTEILEKSTLFGFFFSCFRYENGFFRIRIKTCIEHTSGDCAGRGIKILYLLGMQTFFFEEKSKFDGILGCASGVR